MAKQKSSGGESGEARKYNRWVSWLVSGLAALFSVTICFVFIVNAVRDARSSDSNGRGAREGVVGKVSVKERYVIEECVVREIEGGFLAKVYSCSEIDGGRFLFFLTNVNEECANKLKAAKTGKDFIIFDDVRPVERRGVEKRSGLEYFVFKTNQPFHCATVKIRRVGEKSSGTIVDVNESD